MKIQLSVKELSEIVGIPPRRIRYYHKIGLFSPSHMDPNNGYHYYALEKIEELRLIVYLRHLDVPIQEIKNHLESRNLMDYTTIIKNQLAKTYTAIDALEKLAARLEKRMQSIDYIHHLPPLGHIRLVQEPKRRILKQMKTISGPYDWEIAMLHFEKEAALPPSLFIGDIGFFVALDSLDRRHATEFTGLYLFIDEGEVIPDQTLVDELPQGDWLRVTFKGDHHMAPPYYVLLLDYAKSISRTPGPYAVERVLIDHFISSDPDLYLTEIAIPLLPI